MEDVDDGLSHASVSHGNPIYVQLRNAHPDKLASDTVLLEIEAKFIDQQDKARDRQNKRILAQQLQDEKVQLVRARIEEAKAKQLEMQHTLRLLEAPVSVFITICCFFAH
jgi:hypothetical protein